MLFYLIPLISFLLLYICLVHCPNFSYEYLTQIIPHFSIWYLTQLTIWDPPNPLVLFCFFPFLVELALSKKTSAQFTLGWSVGLSGKSKPQTLIVKLLTCKVYFDKLYWSYWLASRCIVLCFIIYLTRLVRFQPIRPNPTRIQSKHKRLQSGWIWIVL